jgi:hypothetical protein
MLPHGFIPIAEIVRIWYALSPMTGPGSERRSRQRVPVRLPVSIKSAQNASSTGHTRDLSMTGIFLYTDSKMIAGSDLEMVLMLPPELTDGEKRWVCCQASVIRVEENAAGGNFGVAAAIRSIATLPEIQG